MAWPGYLADITIYAKKRKMCSEKKFPLRIKALYPVLGEKNAQAGNLGAYFYQDLHVAKRIYKRKPSKHVDIGSRVDGFVGYLLTFMQVTIVDVRPLNSVEGLTCISADATNLGSCIKDGSIPSLSCLHALEHFGLGRYGDTINPNAWRDGLSEMHRILAPKGVLYLSVPIGNEILEFNAHRIFSPATVPEYASSIGLSMQTAVHINNSGVVKEAVSSQELNLEHYSYSDGSVMIYEFSKV
jgi:predicted SAM-dependent methyltransferase